ncbi:OLC1v1007741C1 [Oldenlandia corymbosa var. corymbosa]|uniref:OLC1v1007741C1 n=1 Tax=Oldenlandia corymbosa var. corymbosa TaxID=529605 RepID=A0AAV1DNB5_OLDCO|nr:OLC1v1007741C1 [Oldenlandia corymbosa var. corymbosa]
MDDFYHDLSSSDAESQDSFPTSTHHFLEDQEDPMELFTLTHRMCSLKKVPKEKLAQGISRHATTLMGFLLDVRSFSRAKMQQYVRNYWEGKAVVQRKEGNAYLFKFRSKEYMLMALHNSSYLIDGAMLVLSRWYSKTPLRRVYINSILIWVRLYGLPSEYLILDAGRDVASILGEVLDIKSDEFDIQENSYLQVRVRINPHDPLKSDFFLDLDLGNDDNIVWIDVQCERMHKFCRRCGVIEHPIKRCEILTQWELERYADNFFHQESLQNQMDFCWDEWQELFPLSMGAEDNSHKSSTKLSEKYM